MKLVRVRPVFLVFLSVFALLSGCGGQAPDADRATSGPAPAGRLVTPSAAPASRRPSEPRIIFLGDSLTAGLGVDLEESFPALIQKRLDAEGYNYKVVNAGVSGDTSAGALRRLEWAMADGVSKLLIVALGGNDGLRGLPPEQLEKNLAAIIDQAQRRGVRVILAGMEAPPNFGADYTSRFRGVYSTLATRYKVRLIPFLLEGVAGHPTLNQPDGIHPNPRGASIVADLVWRSLEPELAQLRAPADR